MSKFVKIIINRKTKHYQYLEYLPAVIALYKKFSKYLHDDYFVVQEKDEIDLVLELVEKISPYFWAIVTSKNEVAGFVFLDNWVGSGQNLHSAEITTCFAPKFWGKYTKYCARKFIKYCFKKYKLKKLKATIFEQNFKVKAILKHVGFKKEASLKAETLKNGIAQNVDIYSIICPLSRKS